jgi:hypothetical protein
MQRCWGVGRVDGRVKGCGRAVVGQGIYADAEAIASTAQPAEFDMRLPSNALLEAPIIVRTEAGCWQLQPVRQASDERARRGSRCVDGD